MRIRDVFGKNVSQKIFNSGRGYLNLIPTRFH